MAKNADSNGWGSSGGKDRAERRSKTFHGIAEAMAAQWGDGEYPEFVLKA